LKKREETLTTEWTIVKQSAFFAGATVSVSARFILGPGAQSSLTLATRLRAVAFGLASFAIATGGLYSRRRTFGYGRTQVSGVSRICGILLDPDRAVHS
jgi:hypothetical protein